MRGGGVLYITVWSVKGFERGGEMRGGDVEGGVLYITVWSVKGFERGGGDERGGCGGGCAIYHCMECEGV